MDTPQQLRRRVRVLLMLFIAGLVVSGLTAFPLEAELDALSIWLGIDPAVPPAVYSGGRWWIATVALGVRETNANYPFIAYGTDWLAFAHLVIAVAFIGPMRDPVRNLWVVTFGLIACAAVIPFALIAGQVRGIPFYWRLIDCSFGVIGAILLLWARRCIVRLAVVEAGPAR